MKTVVLEVSSLEDSLASAARILDSGRAEREVRISFATPELLCRFSPPSAGELLKALCGAGAVSIRKCPYASVGTRRPFRET